MPRFPQLLFLPVWREKLPSKPGMETMLQDINYCMRPETEPGAGKLVRLINPTDNLRYHRHWELYLPRQGKNASELRGKRKNSRLQWTSETGTSFRLRNSIWRIFFPITCVRYAERNYNIFLSSPLPTSEPGNEAHLHRNVSSKLHYFWRFELLGIDPGELVKLAFYGPNYSEPSLNLRLSSIRNVGTIVLRSPV